jgi:translocon-associated protein subunit beta
MSPRPLALLCAVLIAAALLSSSSSTASDAPFLVAHKKVALTRPRPGLEHLAVSLDLYNQGSA